MLIEVFAKHLKKMKNIKYFEKEVLTLREFCKTLKENKNIGKKIRKICERVERKQRNLSQKKLKSR